MFAAGLPSKTILFLLPGMRDGDCGASPDAIAAASEASVD